MWNIADEIILISLVKAKIPIWKEDDEQHRNTHALAGYWDQISNSLSKNKSIIQCKWKALLRRMRREIVTVETTGEKSTWLHYDRMSFIVKKTDAEDLIEKFDNDLENNFTEGEFTDSTKQDRNTNSDTSMIPVGQTKKALGNNVYNEQKSVQSDNEDIQFFNTLLPDLRLIKRKKRLKLRQEITSLVLRYVYNENGLCQKDDEDCIIIDVKLPKREGKGKKSIKVEPNDGLQEPLDIKPDLNLIPFTNHCAPPYSSHPGWHPAMALHGNMYPPNYFSGSCYSMANSTANAAQFAVGYGMPNIMANSVPHSTANAVPFSLANPTFSVMANAPHSTSNAVPLSLPNPTLNVMGNTVQNQMASATQTSNVASMANACITKTPTSENPLTISKAMNSTEQPDQHHQQTDDRVLSAHLEVSPRDTEND